jgi:DNA invertase Pin-like site-specific DNA recombinase
MSEPDLRRFVGYLRGKSAARQQRQIQASTLGDRIAFWITEEHVLFWAGREIRPGLRAAFAACGSGNVDGIVVTDVSRLGRHTETVSSLISLAKFAGVELIVARR